MAQYASNFDEFVKKSLEAIRTNLNETETGRELYDDLLRETLRKNPNTTPEEWEKIKQDFLTFCFLPLCRDARKQCTNLERTYTTN